MTRLLRRFGILGLLVIACVVTASPAAAHPLGNFSVNRYTRIVVEAGVIRLHYVVDMAEIPTYQEILGIDKNRDGVVSDDERNEYLRTQSPLLRRNLSLTLNGQRAELAPVAQSLEFLLGQGGLLTLRLTMDLTAQVPEGPRPIRAEYRDGNYADRPGWSEIILRATPSAGLQQTSVPANDQTNELRVYPEDLLTNPVVVTAAQFSFEPGAVGIDLPILAPLRETAARAQDAFTQLITADELAPGVIAVSFFIAMGLGAMHALSPGHGKTVVAAYLVGSRGTAKHAMFLGATVTITHTIGVFALGLVTLFLANYILPERLYPWLELISGLIVVIIGVSLFASRLRWALAPKRPLFAFVGAGAHEHTHDHHHDHALAHAHGHHHHHDHAHDHAHGHALHHHHHEHDHGHHHGALVHSHGGFTHSHLPPGADGSPVTWRSLLGLGISGGLLPCPSALVVMLSAIALGRVAFGLFLIVAFSIGLAGVLVAFGMALVYARSLFERLPTDARVGRLLPVASAAVIVVLGVVITAGALQQTRIL